MTTWVKKEKAATSYQQEGKASTTFQQGSKASMVLGKLIDWFARGWFSYGWFTGEPGHSFTKASKPATTWNKE